MIQTISRRVASLVLLAMLSSCAPGLYPTPYARSGSAGGYGYSEAPLDENSYRISFLGNSATNQEMVERYAFFRAAELTAQKGYDYFMVLNKDDQAQTYTGSKNDVRTVDEGWPGRPDLSTSKTEASSSTWSYNEYRSSIVIRLFRGVKPQSSFDSYDAHAVTKNMDSLIVRPSLKD